MSQFLCLQRDWRESLAHLLASAERELLICSPYITSDGIRFVEECSRAELRRHGKCTVVTNLSPTNVVQGVTDPRALQRLSRSISNMALWHLPRLHAKVYVADAATAIVTSANLTRGGTRTNYEYGMRVADVDTVTQIRSDIISYGELGTRLTDQQLACYIEVADEVRAAFETQQRSITRTAKARFEQLFYKAENELIALRLAGAPVTQVFARTIVYLLQRHGAMTTPELHSHIAAIHPDLCDDTIDRVINGRHFGKKWKNLVRTAQSQLKVQSVIELSERRWKLVEQD